MTTRKQIVKVLAAHHRKTGARDLSVHCVCGWVHPDGLFESGDVLRGHVADALVELLAEHGPVHPIRPTRKS